MAYSEFDAQKRRTSDAITRQVQIYELFLIAEIRNGRQTIVSQRDSFESLEAAEVDRGDRVVVQFDAFELSQVGSRAVSSEISENAVREKQSSEGEVVVWVTEKGGQFLGRTCSQRPWIACKRFQYIHFNRIRSVSEERRRFDLELRRRKIHRAVLSFRDERLDFRSSQGVHNHLRVNLQDRFSLRRLLLLSFRPSRELQSRLSRRDSHFSFSRTTCRECRSFSPGYCSRGS